MQAWCEENKRAFTEAEVRAAMREYFTAVRKEERKSDVKGSKSKDTKKADTKARDMKKRNESTVDSGDESQDEGKNSKDKKPKDDNSVTGTEEDSD